MTDVSLPARIRALRDLSVPELRELYVTLSGRSTRTDNRTWLVGAIVRQMTEGVTVEGRNARRTLARAIHAAHLPRRRPTPPTVDPRVPAIGITLTRLYQGREIEVRVTTKGFVFERRTWPSLSAIARHVSCTRWNGSR